MHRRFFLQHALTAPLIVPPWKSAPPSAYTAELSSLMRAAPVPGAVIGALHSHRLSWITPLGVRAAGSPDPISAATLFHAANLTKQVTAHAAFALRAEASSTSTGPSSPAPTTLPTPPQR